MFRLNLPKDIKNGNVPVNNGLPDNGIFSLIFRDMSFFYGFVMLIADESSTLPPIRACWSFFLQEFGC